MLAELIPVTLVASVVVFGVYFMVKDSMKIGKERAEKAASEAEAARLARAALEAQELEEFRELHEQMLLHIAILMTRPDDDAAIAAFREFFDGRMLPLSAEKVAIANLQPGLTYSKTLGILALNPGSIPLRTLSLDVGRWYHSLHREQGLVTIADEMAMHNDIFVRTVAVSARPINIASQMN